MKKALAYLAVILIVAVTGCKKEQQAECTSTLGYIMAVDSPAGCYFHKEYNKAIGDTFEIDVNDDGFLDFRFTSYYSHSATGSYWQNEKLTPLTTQAEFVADTIIKYVQEFNDNKIDSNYYWRNATSNISSFSHITVPPNPGDYYKSNWTQPTGYIGIRINTNGIYKYGWIKLYGSTIISSMIEK